jgi:hypothetical protein
MDVFFAAPAAPALRTEEKTRRSGSGLGTNWSWGPMDSTQIGLLATGERSTAFLTVLYPRLKTEAAPVFTTIANGQGIMIRHAGGVDYVFAGREKVAFKDERVDFEGTVGVAQLRGAKPALFLGAEGRLAAGGQTITSDKASAAAGANLLDGGDFESGKLALPLAAPYADTELSVADGDPLKTTRHEGRHCLALKMKGATGYVGYTQNLYVDSTRVYRIKARYACPTNMMVSIGGYASDGKGANLPDGKGGVWQWGIGGRGAPGAWQETECTVGPAGAGATYTWPTNALSTGLGIWLSGQPADTAYLDDLSFEPAAKPASN